MLPGLRGILDTGLAELTGDNASSPAAAAAAPAGSGTSCEYVTFSIGDMVGEKPSDAVGLGASH